MRRQHAMLLLAGVLAACTKHSPNDDATALDRAPSDPAQITGRYRYAPNAADSTAGCTLDAAARGADSVQYLLDCNRGAPSYNMGSARGVAQRAAQSFAIRFTEYGGECVITVIFSDRAANVEQNGNSAECGFGNAVDASGIYSKVNDDLPTFEEAPR